MDCSADLTAAGQPLFEPFILVKSTPLRYLMWEVHGFDSVLTLRRFLKPKQHLTSKDSSSVNVVLLNQLR